MKILKTASPSSSLLFMLLLSILNLPQLAHAQSLRVLTGVVNDAKTGETLPGVTVTATRSGKSVSSDANGRFSIEVMPADLLVVKMIGFEDQSLEVTDQQHVTVSLSFVSANLQEVVVVGYGTQKKANLTGSVAVINSGDLAGRPATSVNNAIQGLMPGVTVTNSTALPGQNSGTIRIRGIGTLGNSEPLVVIDGIPGGSLSILNPDDIESISVLKDAASSSIYGVRGANGVILVTTKTGKEGRAPAISYTNYFGWQTPTALPEMLGSVDYMTLLNESQRNVGRTPTYTDAEIEKARTGSDPNSFANTNWIDEIYRKNAGQQNHNFNITGGAKDVTYYASYGYLKEGGLITGDNFSAGRHNLRLRLNTTLVDRLKIDANIGYIDRKYSGSSEGLGSGAGPIYAAHQILPLVPVRFTTGGWGYIGGQRNPVAVTTDGGTNAFGSQEITGNLAATLTLAKGLNIRGQYGVVRYNSARTIFSKTINYYSPVDGSLIYQTNAKNKIDERDYRGTYQTFIGYAEYERTIGGRHYFKAMTGASREEDLGADFGATREVLPTQDVPSLNIGTQNQLNNGSASQNALQSLFGRFNYGYKDRYLAELNFRYDGSSRFAKDVRWNLFGSASLGWTLSEERFFEKIRPVVGLAKIRASYGTLGNDRVGSDFPSIATIIPVTTMPIGNVLTSAYAQTTLPNPILTWESVEKQNIGLDLAFLRNRLSVTADYFIHKTNDILLRVDYPDVLGATEPSQNAGKVENRGWELQTGWQDNIKGFRYGFNFNLSDVNNKVVSLGGVPPTFGDRVRFVGEAIDSFYGLVADRIAQVSDFDFNPTTNTYTPKFPFISGDPVQPGDLIYKDLNNDGKLTLADDRKVIGDAIPRYTFGFRADAAWKGIDLSIFLQGVGKASGYIGGAARHAYINEGSLPQKVHLDRWTPDNTDASYPRFTYQQSHNQRLSTYWLEDASYLRLKNVQIGYTLPAAFTQKYRINRFRLYASADNLFTSTNFFYGYDPESPVSTGGFYPQVKTVVFGLNLTLN
ncbi:TonB-dependent receptor [Pedobacter sp. SYSU D00535]|uniref:SusC/RagA family TonB-linked outer membrane protein n=1 Tax=Pedobacter sp. SYSU D00535 TaxID=2810308 RepID=UPI001A95DCB4|nr:TonB-dependent receptor [Pedobacter sp. SYSU D00535]